MFGSINWLGEKIEECLFALLDFFFISESDSWNGNGFASKVVKSLVKFESNLLKSFKIFSFFNLPDNIHNFILFGSCVKNGMLTDLFSFKLIKIIRYSGH